MLRFTSSLGFEAGTSNVSVFDGERGISLTEPSVVAFSRKTNRALAVGRDARPLLDRNMPDAETIRPILSGAVADFDACVEMLKAFIHKALGKNRSLLGPELVASILPGATQVERRALHNAYRSAGASRVTLVDSVLATAIGAGFSLTDSSSRMIVDIGGGTTDIGIISMGTVLSSRSIRFGGQDLDEAIRRYVRHKYSLAVTTNSAEDIKTRVGSVSPDRAKEQVTVDGVQLYGELFRSVSVTLEGIPELLAKAVGHVIAEIRWLLEEIPQEQRLDIISNGIAIAGGTSQLLGLTSLMTEKLGIPVTIANAPCRCTISGVGAMIVDPSRLRSDGKQYRPV